MRESWGGLWRHREFLKLWAGQSISEFGSNMGALSLLALLVLNATPVQMGFLAALEYTPVLVVGLFAGAWVDRLRRRPIMMAADVGRALLLATLPAAYFAGVLRIEQVYVVAALVGVLTVIFSIAYPAYLPSLIPKENLLEGNSKLGMSSSVAHMAGTSIGFTAVQWIGAPLAVLFDAVTYIASIVSIGLIRKPEPPPVPHDERQRIGAEMKEGLKLVMGHPLLRPLVLSAAMRQFFGFFFATLYSLYALRVLKMPPSLLGITIAAGGLGAFFGALLAGRVTQRYRLGTLMIGTMAVTGMLGLLTPMAFGPPLMAAAFLMIPQFFGDALWSVYEIAEVSLRQSVLPERYLGRANASIQFLVGGMGPIGALAGGALGQSIGPRMTLLVAVLGHLASVLILFYSPLRCLDRLETPLPVSLELEAQARGIDPLEPCL